MHLNIIFDISGTNTGTNDNITMPINKKTHNGKPKLFLSWRNIILIPQWRISNFQKGHRPIRKND